MENVKSPTPRRDLSDMTTRPNLSRMFTEHTSSGNYTKNLSEEDEDVYKKEFSKHIKLGTIPYSIEGMYTKAHAASRTDPSGKAEGYKKVTKTDNQVPRRSCRQEPKEEVCQVPKETCRQVPKQVRNQVPRKSCRQVPKEE